jgi:membrane fusion protein, multidrug efflux system
MIRKTKKLIYNIVVIALVLAGIVFISSKYIHLGNVEYTDNAQVKRLIVPVNSRVQSFVKKVYFNEYQPVKKGDTLILLEDTEYKFRLAQAEADYANALAGKKFGNTSVNIAQNNIAVSDASLEEVKALLVNAQTEFKRYKNLLEEQSVTQQEYDAVNTRYLSLKAKYETLVRQKQSTVLEEKGQNVRLSQNDASIQLAKAALDLAKLNLSYTVILAPTDGTTGRKDLQEGQLIQPGQNMVDVVDENEKWIIANYKETQTRYIKLGQTVQMKIDAIPDVIFMGVVKSISKATGASFSILPQDNSAGNFVKVEQRIPVRIEFSKDNDPLALQKLVAGMNVDCTVLY